MGSVSPKCAPLCHASGARVERSPLARARVTTGSWPAGGRKGREVYERTRAICFPLSSVLSSLPFAITLTRARFAQAPDQRPDFIEVRGEQRTSKRTNTPTHHRTNAPTHQRTEHTCHLTGPRQRSDSLLRPCCHADCSSSTTDHGTLKSNFACFLACLLASLLARSLACSRWVLQVFTELDVVLAATPQVKSEENERNEEEFASAYQVNEDEQWLKTLTPLLPLLLFSLFSGRHHTGKRNLKLAAHAAGVA